MNTDPLLHDIEWFLTASGINATTFGRDAMGDPRFVFDLRGGRECRRATRARALLQIAAYQETGKFKDRHGLDCESSGAQLSHRSVG